MRECGSRALSGRADSGSTCRRTSVADLAVTLASARMGG